MTKAQVNRCKLQVQGIAGLKPPCQIGWQLNHELSAVNLVNWA